MGKSRVTLTHSENSLNAFVVYDPKLALDGLSLAIQGAETLKGEYKTGLDVDLDLDLKDTQITCQTSDTKLVIEYPTQSRLTDPVAVHFTASPGMTPLADKIKKANDLLSIKEEQEKKKNAQKKKRNPQSRAPTQGAPSSPCDSPPEIATGAEAERCSEFPSPRAPLPHNDSPGGSTSTSDAVEVFKGLMQEQAASFQMQIKDLQTQMEGLGTQLKKENALLKEENASLKKETARLKHDLTQLRNDNNVLKKDNAQLKQDNARLKQDNARLKQDTEPELARLTKETDALKAENKLLKHNIGLMKEQLRIHTLILHPLHRRAILDNARDNIIADYPRDDWSILFPAPVTTQTPTIVDKIHGVLKVEDRMILTKKAVEAIVVNGSGTIRGVGNVAAHRASDTQQSNAALASDLSEPEEDNEVCFPICSWV